MPTVVKTWIFYNNRKLQTIACPSLNVVSLFISSLKRLIYVRGSELQQHKLFKKLFARAVACDAGGPGSIPGRYMFVLRCSSRGWRRPWSSLFIVVTPMWFKYAGSIPGRDMFVSWCSSRGWIWPWFKTLHSILYISKVLHKYEQEWLFQEARSKMFFTQIFLRNGCRTSGG